jgi:hypothetical protein
MMSFGTVPIRRFRPSGDEELDSCATIDGKQHLRETSSFGIVGVSPALETSWTKRESWRRRIQLY